MLNSLPENSLDGQKHATICNINFQDKLWIYHTMCTSTDIAKSKVWRIFEINPILDVFVHFSLSLYIYLYIDVYIYIDIFSISILCMHIHHDELLDFVPLHQHDGPPNFPRKSDSYVYKRFPGIWRCQRSNPCNFSMYWKKIDDQVKLCPATRVYPPWNQQLTSLNIDAWSRWISFWGSKRPIGFRGLWYVSFRESRFFGLQSYPDAACDWNIYQHLP